MLYRKHIDDVAIATPFARYRRYPPTKRHVVLAANNSARAFFHEYYREDIEAAPYGC